MSPFRVLPRATSEALPPPPIYIIIFPSLSCLTPLASPLPHPLRLDTIYSEHPSRFPLLTPHPSPEPISVTSVLFRRAQISSQVRIKSPQRTPPSFSLLYSHLYLFVQLGLSLSLPPLSLLRHSLLQIFVRNLNLRKKNVTLNTFYSPWPLAFNRLLPLLIHAPPPMS